MTTMRIAVVLVAFLASLATSMPSTAQSSHRKAAKELYLVIGGPNLAVATSEALIKSMSLSKSLSDKQRNTIVQWCREVFTSPECEKDLIDLYVTLLTEKEILDLVAFYKSDLGKKLLKVTPALMEQGALIGRKHGQKHQKRLIEMLEQD